MEQLTSLSLVLFVSVVSVGFDDEFLPNCSERNNAIAFEVPLDPLAPFVPFCDVLSD